MPFLPQVFRRPRKPSRQSRPASLRVPPLILRLVTWQRTSFSEPLVFSGISGLSSTISNSLLLARWRASRRSSEAKRVPSEFSRQIGVDGGRGGELGRRPRGGGRGRRA